MAYPLTHNFSIYQGNTDALSLVWKRDTVAVDLTGYSSRMQIRTAPQSSVVVAEFSTTAGTIVLTSAGGITVHFSSTASAAIPAGSYLYDLDVTTGTDTRTIVCGTLTVAGHITQ